MAPVSDALAPAVAIQVLRRVIAEAAGLTGLRIDWAQVGGAVLDRRSFAKAVPAQHDMVKCDVDD